MISETYNTIFVHIPKTGGQSIEQAFLDAHGLAWEDRAPLLMRANADRAAGPARLAHLTAREYVECGHVTAGTFAAMYSFAVVRHPYDRFMSELRYRQIRRPTTSAQLLAQVEGDRFLDHVRHLMPQRDFVTGRDGAIMVDAIIQFDGLAENIRPVFSRIFGDPPDLPHINRSAPGSGEAAILNDDLKRELYRRYEIDFDTFGFSSGFVR